MGRNDQTDVRRDLFYGTMTKVSFRQQRDRDIDLLAAVSEHSDEFIQEEELLRFSIAIGENQSRSTFC